MIVTTSQLSDFIGKSPRTVEHYVKQGMPVHNKGVGRGNENEFESTEALDWIFGKGKLDFERTRLTALQADHEDLKVKEKSGELAPVKAMVDVLEAMVVAFRTKMLGVPSKLKSRFAIDAAQYEATETLIREALEELSESRLPASLERSEASEAAAETHAE